MNVLPNRRAIADSSNRGLTPPACQFLGSCLFLCSLLLAGCGLKSGQPNPDDRPKRPDQVVDFKTLYSQNCSGCHGADGKLGPAPPLNNALFLRIVSDLELKRVITEGRHDTLMPPFGQEYGGNLTPSQVHVLVKGLRTTWSGKLPVTGPLPTYLESDARRKGAKPGNKDDGADTFMMACAGCHGQDGKGGMDAGALNEPAFLALISDQALRRIIITGRPNIGMPDFADPGEEPEHRPRFKPLTNQDVADLVALLASWRQQAPKSSPKDR